MVTKYFIVTKGNCKLIRIIPILIIVFLLYYIYTHYYNCKKNDKNNDKNDDSDSDSDSDDDSNKKENFTPIIRNMYRPYVRNARIISEGFYNDNNNKINNLFRRFGLY